jgi:hypothetical protein
MPENSEAYSILQAVADLINTNKKEIEEVSTVFKSLEALEDLARRRPQDFPRATVVFGQTEIPRGTQTLGRQAQALLPIIVSIFVVENRDIQKEGDKATKEVRDKLEDVANKHITINRHEIITPLASVGRLVTYESNNQDELIVGLADISFLVDYCYTMGAS